ncbi:MAG: alpha/beta hydrolase [Bacteriovoracia bacterium]
MPFFNTLLAFFVFALSSGCSSLLYYPTNVLYIDPVKAGANATETALKSADGQTIYGWYFHAKSKPKAVIVFFHGNGENMSSHFLNLRWILDYGYDFFIFDYHGYGKSEGDPTPENTIEDGIAAIEFVSKKKLPIAVFGQSLGGAVALQVVAKVKNQYDIKAVFVDSTFHSYKAAGAFVLSQHWYTWPLQPLAYLLLSDSYAPKHILHKISPIPLFVAHGTADSVVSIDLGREVYSRAREKKEFWEIPNCDHIEFLFVEKGKYRNLLLEKLNQYVH